VATLLANADDLAHQGWTGRARKRFGTGILDNRISLGGLYGNASGCVTAAASAAFNLGSGDFTLEGQVRFLSLPSGGTKAVLCGRWDEANNKRSYQLYKGGPTLETGNTVFRISTDGLAGTVTEIFAWPWAPITDRWYHWAVVRAAGETLFFIDGVQQGLPATDAYTYFAATTTLALGAQDDSGNPVANTQVDGFMDEFRATVGVARYTSGFTPPVAAFPRTVGGDPDFASVVWLSGFDSGLFDESSYGRTLTAWYGTTTLTPDDGVFNYQTMNQTAPRDDTFVEAALIPAEGILTQTALPTATKTVTIGTYGLGPTTAVYKWVTALASAFDVLIGATIEDSLTNLMNAMNAGAGEGTTYGTGTTVNNDVTASLLPIDQLLVTANTPGTGGNALTSVTDDPNASWGAGVLAGGEDIPAYSQFYFQRPPNETTVIDSVTIVSRTGKTDSGTCNVQASFVGPAAGVLDGADNPITTVPIYYQDTFEVDPDTSAALTPTSIISGRVRLNRTA
jgi:hypothetical protein